jgi:hypothetical protein
LRRNDVDRDSFAGILAILVYVQEGVRNIGRNYAQPKFPKLVPKNPSQTFLIALC